LPDGPFLFFALLTMWALSAALVAEPGRTIPWLLTGLAWGGALLSKYHAVFLPMGAILYVVVTPSARRLLLRPGPYLAIAVGLLAFAPVLIWNSRHDWASFVFQGGRALGSKFRPDGMATVLVGPAILLLPWIWCGLAAILVSRLRAFRSLAGIDRLLICLAMVPLAFFLAVSTVSPILPHWPLIGFVPLFPMLGARWAVSAVRPNATPQAWLSRRRKIIGMASANLMLSVVVVAQVRLGAFSFPFRDPCDEMSGWKSVGAELGRRGLLDDPDTFLFTTQWSSSGQLAFAERNRLPVLCYNATDPRGFAFWSQPKEWLHHNCLMITLDTWENEVALHKPFFRQMVKEAEFPMTRGGKPFRTVYVYRCIEQVYPFPFQYGPPPPPATGSAGKPARPANNS
jgi:4-amino-4-deoxy-L-arabinose transferase-like glycosyltransferase